MNGGQSHWVSNTLAIYRVINCTCISQNDFEGLAVALSYWFLTYPRHLCIRVVKHIKIFQWLRGYTIVFRSSQPQKIYVLFFISSTYLINCKRKIKNIVRIVLYGATSIPLFCKIVTKMWNKYPESYEHDWIGWWKIESLRRIHSWIWKNVCSSNSRLHV